MWKDNETDIDLLDFDYLIKATKDLIENDNLSPCTIGVYGDWGSGKSSLVDMILKDYKEEDDYLCIKFNGWLFEDYEDAKTALLGTILDKIKEKRTLTSKAKTTIGKLFKNLDYLDLASKGIKYGADFLLTGGIGTITNITIGKVLDSVKSAGGEIKTEDVKKTLEGVFKKEEVRKSLREFHEDFEKLLAQTKIKKLVIFIDELDRCNHDTILETLEAIRLFLFIKGTAFIIGADERQVMYAVRKRYPEVKGNQIDIGKEYLEKMIQYPIKIPQLGLGEVEFYITCLFIQDVFKNNHANIIDFLTSERSKNFLNFQISSKLIIDKFTDLDENEVKEVLSISKQLSSVLARSLNGNPRHCKRFLNSLSMRLKMAEFKKVVLNKKILAKIMLIEYFKEGVYKAIGEMQHSENGKPKELGYVEQDDWDNVKSLKIWKDDEWFKSWIITDPLLAGIDLQPYYYFTRESLQNNISKTLSISPESLEVIKLLKSGSDTERVQAIKKAPFTNDFESLEILKSLFTAIEVSTEIDTKLFTSFIEWGSTKETLITEVIASLSSLPALSIKTAFLPRIVEFAKSSNKGIEIKELGDKWSKENAKLTRIINQDFNTL